ncbi:MAG: DNA starvation/stationary phase protection protein [Lutibacter sp.]|uniref:Dps family protein n=1 Tax=Lutibacter sp. TaxID=1925666 RepID=UPI001802E660|nr:DNA starvation/stationary phase protection protein [Lutibacter sp.]MBT8316694.1 DNA starvation/stationary phase protection protein [Lutibacter sp.]NNJ57554.1 DNA starvation/stationary phase protection protein [Lutibacter sp.]
METLTKNTNTLQKKSYRKLGFTYLETAEIVVHLNELIANYIVHYHKLRNFHWNVDGPEFFELHKEFEDEYNAVQENIDILAERIRVFGIKPSMTMKDILSVSEIKEAKADKMTPIDMVTQLLKDYDILHDKMLNVVNAALENGDNVTEQILTDFMQKLEKRNWMFTSWTK